MSVKKGDIDIEFVLGGEVSLTPNSNLYPQHLGQGVENESALYDNDTKKDHELPEEPDLADLALEDPELYEQVMKEQLDV